MGVDVMKKQLLERVEQGDEQLVSVLFAVSEALEEAKPESEIGTEEVIGYRIGTNEPILADEANDIFEAIVEDVKSGNYVEIDELIKKKSARW